jgi:hypothetical protein
MLVVAQSFRELPEPQKLDHRLVEVCTKNRMASVGSLRNGCATISISQALHCNMPRDFERYGTIGEVEAKSLQNPPNLEKQFLH